MHDVGAPCEVAEDRAIAGIGEVELDAAPAPQPRLGARDLPERIAAGRLDLHDVGPVVGQQHPGDGPGDPPREIQDADPAQHTRHASFPPLGPAEAGSILPAMQCFAVRKVLASEEG